MSVSRSQVWIVDGSTGEPVQAILFHKIVEKHLRDYEGRWRPWLEQAVAAQPSLPRQESAHWDRRKKMEAVGRLLGYPSCAIECNRETQGLMIASTMGSSRLESQKGKPLVYIEFLETAPWNRVTLTGQPRYKRVGPALVDVAIQLSMNEGFHGRVGLHSLPQSDDWYRGICGMTDLGKDPKKQNLRYFEMTIEQARAFLGKGS